MGILDKLKGEFIDIVEWLDDSRDTLVYRFERHNNEIKFGAKLTVREGQAAIFVNEGKLADVFGPGMYTLETKNLPIISTLKGWKHGFNSPFKAEVYFVNTRPFPSLKWGTPSPWPYRDPELGSIRIRAHGAYEVRVTDPAVFLRHLIGTAGSVNTDDVADTLRGDLVQEIGDALGEAKLHVADMLANLKELSAKITEFVKPKIAQQYGLDMIRVTFGGIDLPPEYEEIMRKRSQMQAFGVNYQTLTAGNAMESAAKNPGGGGMASMGMGMGAGAAMAQQMAGAFGQPQQQQQPMGGAPPPLPGGNSQYFVAVNGAQQGPFDVAALQRMASGGQLTRESLVWQQGMSAWTAAGQVPTLSGLFGAAPPPLPR